MGDLCNRSRFADGEMRSSSQQMAQICEVVCGKVYREALRFSRGICSGRLDENHNIEFVAELQQLNCLCKGASFPEGELRNVNSKLQHAI
jgi:hypothetical protein